MAHLGAKPLSSVSCADLADLQPPPVAGLADWAESEAWLEKIVQSAKLSVEGLFAYFRLDKKNNLTAKIMNIKDVFLAQLFPTARQQSGELCPTQPADGGPGRSQLPRGGQDRTLLLQTTYLYYSVLYYILSDFYPMRIPERASRFAKPTVADELVPRVTYLLAIPVFHSSLLVVASMLVQAVAAKDPTGLGATPDRFLSTTRQAGLQHNMLAVWNACRWFQEAFYAVNGVAMADTSGAATAAHSVCPMPPLPGGYLLGRLMRLCEEREVLRDDSVAHLLLQEIGGGGYNDGDAKLVACYLQAYAHRACLRAFSVGGQLLQQYATQQQSRRRQTSAGSMAPETLAAEGCPAAVPLPPGHFCSLAARLVDKVLFESLDLTFNQHVSVVVACCLYSLAKALRIDLAFTTITRAFVTSLPDHSDGIFDREVTLSPAEPRSSTSTTGTVGPTMGGIRSFYNQRFLPRAEGVVRTLALEYQSGALFLEATPAASPAVPPAVPMEVDPAQPAQPDASPDLGAATVTPKPHPEDSGDSSVASGDTEEFSFAKIFALRASGATAATKQAASATTGVRSGAPPAGGLFGPSVHGARSPLCAVSCAQRPRVRAGNGSSATGARGSGPSHLASRLSVLEDEAHEEAERIDTSAAPAAVNTAGPKSPGLRPRLGPHPNAAVPASSTSAVAAPKAGAADAGGGDLGRRVSQSGMTGTTPGASAFRTGPVDPLMAAAATANGLEKENVAASIFGRVVTGSTPRAAALSAMARARREPPTARYR